MSHKPSLPSRVVFDIEYKKARYSMSVNEYAALRGATRPVTSKQEAREVWEPLYRLDIIAGRDAAD